MSFIRPETSTEYSRPSVSKYIVGLKFTHLIVSAVGPPIYILAKSLTLEIENISKLFALEFIKNMKMFLYDMMKLKFPVMFVSYFLVYPTDRNCISLKIYCKMNR